MRVRVLTFNVLAIEHADGAKRHDVVRVGLRDLAPDIVALQEITRRNDLDQAAEILGPDFDIIDHPGFSDGVGACLASRFPMKLVDTVRFDTPGLSWAAAVAVAIETPELGDLLVVHHKPSWELTREDEREEQAVTVARMIEERLRRGGERPVVLLGDFDAAPEAASIRFLRGQQSLVALSVRYQDTWSAVDGENAGQTFTPINPLVRRGEMGLVPGRRIDYILIRCGAHGPTLEVEACELVFDKPKDGIWASDHFAVMADLRRARH